MVQFFIFGASSAYGVGGENGGWADLLKQRLHQNMYSKKGIGEKFELFNFAKSGETIDFVRRTFKDQLNNYRRDGRVIALVAVGGNNSKAEYEPDNFVSTPEDYQKEITRLLVELKQCVDRVIFIGSGPVDESKTNPKQNPLTGGRSFFSNQRRTCFDSVLKDVCKELLIDYIEPGIESERWIKKYLFDDGLHGNRFAHELIADKIWENINKDVK